MTEHAAGDDLEIEFVVTDSEGEAINLAGMDIRFAVARNVGSPAVLGTEIDTPNVTVVATDLPNGVFRVRADGEHTVALSGTYRFECDIEDGDGRVSTVSHGFITFKSGLLA